MVDLSAPVDVYADWIDACDAVAKETAEAAAERPAHRGQHARPAAAAGGGGGQDDFIVDDEDAEGEYED